MLNELAKYLPYFIVLAFLVVTAFSAALLARPRPGDARRR